MRCCNTGHRINHALHLMFSKCHVKRMLNWHCAPLLCNSDKIGGKTQESNRVKVFRTPATSLWAHFSPKSEWTQYTKKVEKRRKRKKLKKKRKVCSGQSYSKKKKVRDPLQAVAFSPLRNPAALTHFLDDVFRFLTANLPETNSQLTLALVLDQRAACVSGPVNTEARAVILHPQRKKKKFPTGC